MYLKQKEYNHLTNAINTLQLSVDPTQPNSLDHDRISIPIYIFECDNENKEFNELAITVRLKDVLYWLHMATNFKV